MYGLGEAERLRAERRHERRLYLVRDDLLKTPREGTPWRALNSSKNDRAFITTMGFNVATFDLILSSGFEERWNSMPIPRADAPSTAAPRLSRRSLDARGALGLILHHLNSTMHDVSLCETFALIPSTVTRYIQFSLQILLITLREMHITLVEWPQGDEFQEHNARICVRHPLLTGAFGSMDGLNLPVQQSREQEIENATFNGWLQGHFISSVFAFDSRGMLIHINQSQSNIIVTYIGDIIACNLNCPGSWHDSRVAKPIFERLRTTTPPGYYLVTDTAFPRGTDQILGKIKAPMKSGTRLPRDSDEREEAMRFDRQLLSYRQTAEWGMRAIQGSFGRLRVPLPINYTEARGDLLETIVRLYNLRSRTIGYNQIRSVYEPIWREGEQEELWNTFEGMLFSDQRQNDRVSRFHLVVSDT